MTLPWFKLYNEFANDPKVQMMTESMQRRLIMIFCLRSNETLETLHETEIAFHLRITETALQETKQLFIEKGFIDDRWNVLSWEYRQQAYNTSTERVRKHRIKQKQQLNHNKTSNETPETLHETNETLHANARIEEDIDIDKDIEDINKPQKIKKISNNYTEDFEDFWLQYPSYRRTEKPKAFSEWKLAIRKKQPDLIIEAVIAYSKSKQVADGFAPYPAKWLKNERWNDDNTKQLIPYGENTHGNKKPTNKDIASKVANQLGLLD